MLQIFKLHQPDRFIDRRIILASVAAPPARAQKSPHLDQAAHRRRKIPIHLFRAAEDRQTPDSVRALSIRETKWHPSRSRAIH
jgi:hypothetical protein